MLGLIGRMISEQIWSICSLDTQEKIRGWHYIEFILTFSKIAYNLSLHLRPDMSQIRFIWKLPGSAVTALLWMYKRSIFLFLFRLTQQNPFSNSMKLTTKLDMEAKNKTYTKTADSNIVSVHLNISIAIVVIVVFM